MIDYRKILVEVDEILNYLSEEDLLKIPEKIRMTIKEKKDKEYFWKYDETKPLKDQDVSRSTIAFLSYLNMEYLLNEEQKALIEQIHKLNEKKLEESKPERRGVENLFKKDEENNEVNEEVKALESEVRLTEYKENFFSKLINKVKSIFTK